MKTKKSTRHKDILFILISSFIIVVAWIGFNLYHISVTSTISPEVQSHLTPLNPAFDTATIQRLQARERIVPLFERQTTPSATPAPTSTETVATDSSRFAPTDTPIIRTGQ